MNWKGGFSLCLLLQCVNVGWKLSCRFAWFCRFRFHLVTLQSSVLSKQGQAYNSLGLDRFLRKAISTTGRPPNSVDKWMCRSAVESFLSRPSDISYFIRERKKKAKKAAAQKKSPKLFMKAMKTAKLLRKARKAVKAMKA